MKYADKLLLYAVTDRSWLGGKTLYEEVEHAIQGGVTFVQLREKRLEDTAFLKEAQEIQKLCKKYHVPFVINDNVEIAARIHADGVHIGQSDMEVKKARERLGNERIIGVSAQTVEQAVRAERTAPTILVWGRYSRQVPRRMPWKWITRRYGRSAGQFRFRLLPSEALQKIM